MSGHSKWANIKHKKAAADAKRGKIFTRLIKEITVASRLGGGDPAMNPRLRLAIDKASENNMPKDNVERAIKRGTGDLEGVHYEEVRYEGFGAGGAAVIADCMTDNRVRTVADVRHAFTKYGGNLGEAGCVAWMFSKRSLIVFPKGKASEDQLFDIVVPAGADDIRDEGENWAIESPPDAHETVLAALKKNGIEPTVHEVSMIPQTHVHLDGRQAEAMIKMAEALEEHDDVQNLHANFDIEEKQLEALTR